MNEASSKLLQLRPVTFYYKDAPGPDRVLQYGLIAEEVAKVYPELVVRDSAGNVQSVQYHELPAMLLNELEKQRKKITVAAGGPGGTAERFSGCESNARSIRPLNDRSWAALVFHLIFANIG